MFLLSANEMVDGKCVGITQVGSYYIVYAGMAFTLFYALPSVILIILYGMVVFTLQKRMADKTLGTSEALEKASVKVRFNKSIFHLNLIALLPAYTFPECLFCLHRYACVAACSYPESLYHCTLQF